MADFSQPVLTSLYVDVLAILKDRDTDLASMFSNQGTAATNISTGTMQFYRNPNTFRQWNGTTWTDMPIGVTGGGTGAGNATDARTNLGLGTMATQNASNVAITGGTISGIAAFSVSGAITAGSFTGDGAGLTNLNASQLTTGTIPDGRFPAVLPALNGGNLYNLNASALAFGIVGTARLGSGSPGTTTFLRGDQVWAPPPGAGGIPSGMLMFSPYPCPPGFTRVAAWDGYYVRMNSVHGSGGANTHQHGPGSYAAAVHNHGAGSYSIPGHNHGGSTGGVGISITISGETSWRGDHSHGYSGNISGTTGDNNAGNMNVDAGNSGNMSRGSHGHDFGANYSGETNGNGGHNHSFSGSGSGTGWGSIPSEGGLGVSGASDYAGGGAITGVSDVQANMPAFVDLFCCMKD